MEKALIAFCCVFVLLLSVDYGSHCSSVSGFVFANSKHRIIDLWWTVKDDAGVLIGVGALCAAVIYARDRKKNKYLELRWSEHPIMREATFSIGIVSAALIIWPFIFYTLFHSQGIISKTSTAAFLSVLVGCVLAIWGLLRPKEGRQELHYYGKMICAIVVIFELIGALLMMRSCVDGLRRIQ